MCTHLLDTKTLAEKSGTSHFVFFCFTFSIFCFFLCLLFKKLFVHKYNHIESSANKSKPEVDISLQLKLNILLKASFDLQKLSKLYLTSKVNHADVDLHFRIHMQIRKPSL